MHDVALEQREPAQLLEEIARLRAEILRLESVVEELDQLAHRDPLVPLALKLALKVFPPSFGTRFIVVTCTSFSADMPLVSSAIS